MLKRMSGEFSGKNGFGDDHSKSKEYIKAIIKQHIDEFGESHRREIEGLQNQIDNLRQIVLEQQPLHLENENRRLRDRLQEQTKTQQEVNKKNEKKLKEKDERIQEMEKELTKQNNNIQKKDQEIALLQQQNNELSNRIQSLQQGYPLPQSRNIQIADERHEDEDITKVKEFNTAINEPMQSPELNLTISDDETEDGEDVFVLASDDFEHEPVDLTLIDYIPPDSHDPSTLRSVMIHPKNTESNSVMLHSTGNENNSDASDNLTISTSDTPSTEMVPARVRCLDNTDTETDNEIRNEALTIHGPLPGSLMVGINRNKAERHHDATTTEEESEDYGIKQMFEENEKSCLNIEDPHNLLNTTLQNYLQKQREKEKSISNGKSKMVDENIQVETDDSLMTESLVTMIDSGVNSNVILVDPDSNNARQFSVDLNTNTLQRNGVMNYNEPEQILLEEPAFNAGQFSVDTNLNISPMTLPMSNSHPEKIILAEPDINVGQLSPSGMENTNDVNATIRQPSSIDRNNISDESVVSDGVQEVNYGEKPSAYLHGNCHKTRQTRASLDKTNNSDYVSTTEDTDVNDKEEKDVRKKKGKENLSENVSYLMMKKELEEKLNEPLQNTEQSVAGSGVNVCTNKINFKSKGTGEKLMQDNSDVSDAERAESIADQAVGDERPSNHLQNTHHTRTTQSNADELINLTTDTDNHVNDIENDFHVFREVNTLRMPSPNLANTHKTRETQKNKEDYISTTSNTDTDAPQEGNDEDDFHVFQGIDTREVRNPSRNNTSVINSGASSQDNHGQPSGERLDENEVRQNGNKPSANLGFTHKTRETQPNKDDYISTTSNTDTDAPQEGNIVNDFNVFQGIDARSPDTHGQPSDERMDENEVRQNGNKPSPNLGFTHKTRETQPNKDDYISTTGTDTDCQQNTEDDFNTFKGIDTTKCRHPSRNNPSYGSPPQIASQEAPSTSQNSNQIQLEPSEEIHEQEIKRITKPSSELEDDFNTFKGIDTTKCINPSRNNPCDVSPPQIPSQEAPSTSQTHNQIQPSEEVLHEQVIERITKPSSELGSSHHTRETQKIKDDFVNSTTDTDNEAKVHKPESDFKVFNEFDKAAEKSSCEGESQNMNGTLNTTCTKKKIIKQDTKHTKIEKTQNWEDQSLEIDGSSDQFLTNVNPRKSAFVPNSNSSVFQNGYLNYEDIRHTDDTSNGLSSIPVTVEEVCSESDMTICGSDLVEEAAEDESIHINETDTDVSMIANYSDNSMNGNRSNGIANNSTHVSQSFQAKPADCRIRSSENITGPNTAAHQSNRIPKQTAREQTQQHTRTRGSHNYPEDNGEKIEEEILFIYHNESQEWIRHQILQKLSYNFYDMKLVLQHMAMTTGSTRQEMVVRSIRKCKRIIVVLSQNFSQCDLSSYALGYVVSDRTFRDKLIVIESEICTSPPLIAHFQALNVNNPSFWKSLFKCIKEDLATDKEQPNKPLPLRGELPCLLIKERPKNPIEPHLQHNISIPSTPEKRSDKKVVFLVNILQSADEYVNLFDRNGCCSRCCQYKVRVGKTCAYRYVKDNPNPIAIEESNIPKCVKYWEDNFRQPKNDEEYKNEFGFYIRLKNAHDFYKILVYLQFDLVKIEPGTNKETVLHSVTLDFETKPKKPKAKKQVQFKRKHGNVGDDEDADDFPGERNYRPRSHKETVYSRVGGTHKPGVYGGSGGASGTQDTNGLNNEDNVDGYIYTRSAANDPKQREPANFDILEELLGVGAKPKPSNPLYRESSEARVKRLPPSTISYPSLAADPPCSDQSSDENETNKKKRPHNIDKETVTTENIDDAQEEVQDEEKKLRVNLEKMYTAKEWIDADVSLKQISIGVGKKYQYGTSSFFLSRRYYDMIVELEGISDKVKDPKLYIEFMDVADKYINQYKHKQRSDEKIIILLKKAGVNHYVNELSKASANIRESLELIPKAKYQDRLEARIYYYISTIYREKKKFGKAKHWIRKSKDLLTHCEPGEDTAKAFYNEGRLYMRMLLASSKNEECRLAAIRCFEMAMDHANHEHSQYGMRLDVKLIRRCLLNMARILVDVPETPIGRKRNIVTLEDIEKAVSCIRSLTQPKYMHNISRRNEVQMLLAESGIAYRRAYMFNRMSKRDIAESHIGKATTKAAMAKNLATKDNFKEELMAADFEKFLKSNEIYKKQNLTSDWNTKRNFQSTQTESSPGYTGNDEAQTNYTSTLHTSVLITDLGDIQTDGDESCGKESDVH